MDWTAAGDVHHALAPGCVALAARMCSMALSAYTCPHVRCPLASLRSPAAPAGRVPPGWQPDAEQQAVQQVKRRGGARYCKKCVAYKPPRTHHCRRCGHCVLRMDHHCAWVNNCIGKLPGLGRYLVCCSSRPHRIEGSAVACEFCWGSGGPPAVHPQQPGTPRPATLHAGHGNYRAFLLMCIFLAAACLHALALVLKMDAHLVSVSRCLGGLIGWAGCLGMATCAACNWDAHGLG